MLTIGKIGGRDGGQWRQPTYYTQQVANGAEDYYSGKGEAPGAWTGSGAAALGLSGTLEEGDLEALFDRQHPATGAALGRVPGPKSVRGIDLQMAVPKSVSTLWALADEYGHGDVAARIWEATHGASSAALDYLERHACTSRAGRGGHVRLRGEGFIGAAFPHRFSREGDPQVHVHVLVANTTMAGDPAQGVDPAWRTLDARDLYQHKMAAGYLFQAELRRRLTESLGVSWTEVHKGAAEIDGVPRTLALALSQRSAQIARWLGAGTRRGTAREAEIAALKTRRAKQEVDLPQQRKRCRALAEEHGFGPEQFAHTLNRTPFVDLTRIETAVAMEALVEPDGLTRERSTFARRDVVQQLAAEHRRGGSVERIEALADRLIASDQVITLDAAEDRVSLNARLTARRVPAAEPLLTTPDILAIEAEMLDKALERRGTGAGVVPLAIDHHFERRPSGLVLSDEQRQAVAQLVTSGNGIEIVRAKAGTGKTTAVDAARQLWQDAGYRVIGAALAGRAADELRSRAGIENWTVHGLLLDLERRGEWSLDSDTILVVDEAGMVDTRRLAALLDHAADAGAKVVLLGDERQVPAVEAGGAFAALAERLGAIELTQVHRQQHAWDRDALDHLRHGDLAQGSPPTSNTAASCRPAMPTPNSRRSSKTGTSQPRPRGSRRRSCSPQGAMKPTTSTTSRAILERRIWGLETSLETARHELTNRTDVTAASADLEQWITNHEMELVEASAAENELAIRRAEAYWRATHSAALDADPALERILGERPSTPSEREAWEQAAAYESYRLQYGVFPTDQDAANLVDRQATDMITATRLLERFAPSRSLDRNREPGL